MSKMPKICIAALAILYLSVTAAHAQSKPATTPTESKSTSKSTRPAAKTAAAKVEAPAVVIDSSKSVYVVPMGIKKNGMFGLDIHPQVYELIAKDIVEKRPDIVVFVLNSADLDSVRYLGDDPRKFGIFDDDSQRKMSRDLKEAVEKVGATAIMIIRDAVGYSALLGLSWPNMYMTESARLMGLERIQERLQVTDPEVLAKFREAFVGICTGFLVAGGYSPSIGLAMMRPEKKLSAAFKGREVVWTEDDKGSVLVDGSEKHTAQFTAESAELLGLSDGTVSDDDATMIEDLMYQRGFRNFRRMNEGEVLVQEYIDGWRKALADCVKAYPQYQEAIGNAQGKDEKKYVQKAKGILESVISKMKKYKAVEIMLNKDGITRINMETEVLKLQERIRGLGKSTAPPAGGGRKGGGGGMGPGSSLFGVGSVAN